MSAGKFDRGVGRSQTDGAFRIHFYHNQVKVSGVIFRNHLDPHDRLAPAARSDLGLPLADDPKPMQFPAQGETGPNSLGQGTDRRPLAPFEAKCQGGPTARQHLGHALVREGPFLVREGTESGTADRKNTGVKCARRDVLDQWGPHPLAEELSFSRPRNLLDPDDRLPMTGH